jgi:hypothetical protein
MHGTSAAKIKAVLCCVDEARSAQSTRGRTRVPERLCLPASRAIARKSSACSRSFGLQQQARPHFGAIRSFGQDGSRLRVSQHQVLHTDSSGSHFVGPARFVAYLEHFSVYKRVMPRSCCHMASRMLKNVLSKHAF